MQTRRVRRTRRPGEETHVKVQPHTLLQHSAPARQLNPAQSLLLQMSAMQGNRAVQRFINPVQRQLEDVMEPVAGEPARTASNPNTVTQESYRFVDDPAMAEIKAGTKALKNGSRGMDVRKMQQALVDLGFPLAQYSVDGIFGSETEGALKAFQASIPITQDGVFGKESIEAMQARFDTRQPYLAQSTYNPAEPGTRELTSQEVAAAHEAMVPQHGEGGEFREEVGGVKYGDAVRIALSGQIDYLHYEKYRSKAPLRASQENLYDWNVIESSAKAGKDVTDAVYGSYAQGPEIKEATGKLKDAWEDEEERNQQLTPEEKKTKARNMVIYLNESRLSDLHAMYSAIPSREREQEILNPIFDEFVDTPEKVEKMLQIEMGWSGSMSEGVIYVQRFKGQTPKENRLKLWSMFHMFIHEYLHSLTHPRYFAYAESLNDYTRWNTLVEGMNDFFTENVRASLKPDEKLQQQIEGPHYTGEPPPTMEEIGKAVYPSIRQAEQVVGIIGIKNIQEAYFHGQLRYIRGWGW